MLIIDSKKISPEIQAKYKLVNNSFRQLAKTDSEDMLTIEVGDVKQPEFYPQIKICRWGDNEDTNEVNFSLRAQEHPLAIIETVGDVIKYIAPDYEVHIYDKGISQENPEGAGEFEWVLKSKPAMNVLTATIQTKGLSFYYQPSLTSEEIAEGVSRPDNVVGSYAVYHSTKSNHKVGDKNYKCGKAFHIYRPKAIDANGVEQWCDLNINEAKGLLTVTVPQKFLDEAVYPVRVDPTFGYTTAGASRASSNIQQIRVRIGVPTDSGTVDSVTLSANAESSNRLFRGGVYDNSAGLGLLSPQGSEITVSGTTQTWYTSIISGGPSITGGDTYWAAIISNGALSPNTIGIYYDTGGTSGDSKFTVSITYPNWSNPLNGINSTIIHSIYATYTASGGAASTPLRQLMGMGT